MAKPFRLFKSPVTGAYYVSRHYTIDDKGYVTITGSKFDVSTDVLGFIQEATKQLSEQMAGQSRTAFSNAIKAIIKRSPKDTEILKVLLAAINEVEI